MTDPTTNALLARIKELEEALKEIISTPYTMANDSESLTHTIVSLKWIAQKALNK